MIVIKIFILIIFWNILKTFPPLLNYSENTKFSIYRSLICLILAGFSLQNSFNHFHKGFIDPFTYNHSDLTEIHNVFIAYIIFDLIKISFEKSKRIDLYIHHFWCLGSFLLAKHYGHCGYFHSLLLFNEVISIVSGIDSMAMEDKELIVSAKCKKFRKIIIQYFRLPIWISLFLVVLKFTPKLPTIIWWNGVLTIILMVILDRYWEKKCDKVINKYYKS